MGRAGGFSLGEPLGPFVLTWEVPQFEPYKEVAQQLAGSLLLDSEGGWVRSRPTTGPYSLFPVSLPAKQAFPPIAFQLSAPFL